MNVNTSSIIDSILAYRFSHKITDNKKREFLENISLKAKDSNSHRIDSQINWNS